MSKRPKKYRLNDFNLGHEAELRRGSLEKGDGIHVPMTWKPNGNLGWVPSQVKMVLLGRNVRFALEWRADLSQPVDFGLARLFTGLYVAEQHDFGPSIGKQAPFGWLARKVPDRDVIVIAPWWYFGLHGVRWLIAGVRERIEQLALRTGAARYTADWQRLVWWPSCPRFE